MSLFKDIFDTAKNIVDGVKSSALSSALQRDFDNFVYQVHVIEHTQTRKVLFEKHPDKNAVIKIVIPTTTAADRQLIRM